MGTSNSVHSPAIDCLILYCRAGFERECAAEIMTLAAGHGANGTSRAQPGDGYIVFTAHDPAAVERLWRTIRWQNLIFARQLLRGFAHLCDLSGKDRATPIAQAAAAFSEPLAEVWLEHPDTNPGKSMSRFCTHFTAPLTTALRRTGLQIHPQAAKRLHVFFPKTSQEAFLGLSDRHNSAPWRQGIPRLRMRREAPSRSALKLDEALLTFLDSTERTRALKAGMRAVDLGAAPGGWSWQLARQGLRVVAVDHGTLAETVLASGLVAHLRMDAFHYQPAKPADWMVCDLIEAPRRITRLVGNWLVRGSCRRAIFNLKLPMKNRYQAVRECLDSLMQHLRARGVAFELAAKQLYHDREEVTVYLVRKV